MAKRWSAWKRLPTWATVMRKMVIVALMTPPITTVRAGNASGGGAEVGSG